MTYYQEIISNMSINLTYTMIGNNEGMTPQNIAKWCYSQHQHFYYYGMYLIVIAIVTLLLYNFMLRKPFSGIHITENYIYTHAELLKDLILIATLSLYLFSLFWVYNYFNYHFLDFMLKVG